MKITASYTFQDEHFMTAEDKRIVLKQWRSFLTKLQSVAQDPRGYHTVQEADYGHYPMALDKPFTERLYHHLTLHCEFIAHYNRRGFLGTYFAVPRRTLKFLSQFDGHGELRSIEYGRYTWHLGTYEDINQAMIDVATPLMTTLIPALQARQREQDVAEATRLVAKYGLQVVGPLT